MGAAYAAGGPYCAELEAAVASSTGIITAARHMLDILPSRSLSGRERGPTVQPQTFLRGGKFMFCGSIPALVTPFSGGRVAEDTFAEFVEWQIAEGSDALVPCGTTGESATLSRDEHRAVIAQAVCVAKGRVPVIAGCGSYSTAAAIEMVRTAADVGADAVLVVVPYYNKPSQAGLAAHFTAVAEASQ